MASSLHIPALRPWPRTILSRSRTIQPEGPYFHGGFCLGAVISFEIAQRLHACGESVALLAALDASGPRFNKSPRDYFYFVQHRRFENTRSPSCAT